MGSFLLEPSLRVENIVVMLAQEAGWSVGTISVSGRVLKGYFRWFFLDADVLSDRNNVNILK